MARLLLASAIVATGLCGSPRGANTWYATLGATNEADTLKAAQYMHDNLLQYSYDTLTLDEARTETTPYFSGERQHLHTLLVLNEAHDVLVLKTTSERIAGLV